MSVPADSISFGIVRILSIALDIPLHQYPIGVGLDLVFVQGDITMF